MIKIKKVFVSFPYSDNPRKRKEQVNNVCKEIINDYDDVLPISPLHLFSFIDNEDGYREEIMDLCKNLIYLCDELWVYTDFMLTEGQKEEIDYAVKCLMYGWLQDIKFKTI